MDIIHEYTMDGGCHVLVREAQVDGVLPEDEDDGTLQYGLNVGFLVPCEELVCEFSELLRSDGGTQPVGQRLIHLGDIVGTKSPLRASFTSL